MRISDWSSDVCSSDLRDSGERNSGPVPDPVGPRAGGLYRRHAVAADAAARAHGGVDARAALAGSGGGGDRAVVRGADDLLARRSEEHTSELQSLMRISYAVFCLKKKTKR